jgi:G8 domain
MVSKKKSYSLPYIAGKIYNIWWLTGLDFDHLTLTSSLTLAPIDPAIIFKFNYTDNRELYEVGPIRPGEPLTTASLFVRNDLGLDANNCQNGEYSHDNTAGYRTFSICASPINRTYFETTDVTAIYCRYLCPAPPGEFVKESFVRYWSNVSQWPEGRLPAAGENVSVNGNWTIIMDIDPAPCEFMTIDGDVIIEDIQDRKIECDTLWIRAGKITAGSTAIPFTHKLTFKINGLKNSSGYVFDDSLVGNKLLVVSGTLSLIGASPASLYSRLTATVQVGATQLTV